MDELIKKLSDKYNIITLSFNNKLYIKASELCKEFQIKKIIIRKIDGNKYHKIKFQNQIYISFEGLTYIFPIINKNIENIKKYDEIIKKISELDGELYSMNSYIINDLKSRKNIEELNKIKNRTKEIFVIKLDLSNEKKTFEKYMNKIYEAIEFIHDRPLS